MKRISYGDHPSQFAELHLPDSASPVPVVVVVHGGFWQQRYDLGLGRPLAEDLTRHGVAAWNVEYRRIGGGGGWPATLLDVSGALDALVRLEDPRLDLTRLVTLGHSAGGHLAVWAAARHDAVTGAVAQAGVLDFRLDPEITRRAAELLGGDPEQVPDRYRLSSPAELVPIGRPVVCVHGDADSTVPLAQSESFQRAARAAGDPVDLVRVPGAGHMDLVELGTPGWEASRDAVLRLVGATGPE
ncbi:alpha/beta hydrolase family protein [Umezawaea beigongshangensis]|uniref:alpha/beta hydrolase family protein n=1 Tax=Umezawaea beigongshangensis TaxID=2780383 RepID=UPI0027DD9368|nr:prolyl oligopeptidase family serine peptidase [Umezawaea beigongshangensis]